MAMMQFLHESIESYLHSLAPDRDAILTEMEKIAEERNFPIVGPLIGQFLKQMAAAIQAKNIFEMGSGYGYSALWFLKGMPPAGKIILTDDDSNNMELAKKYFKRAGYLDRAEFKAGDAIKTLEKTKGTFDLIFIDLHKHQYPLAFHKAVPRLRQGGLLLADNVLWSGTVVEPGLDRDELGIKKFNLLAHSAPHLITTIVPIRDGLSISVKV